MARSRFNLLTACAVAWSLAAVGDPCPEDTKPGRLQVWVRAGTDDLREVKRTTTTRVTVYAASGAPAAQGEGNLDGKLHSFRLPSGEYRLQFDGVGLREMVKNGVFVIANKTTDVEAYMEPQP